MPFLDLFSEVSERYAAIRPHYPDALFARLAVLTPAKERAWDCATGNGQAALGLARWFERVDATDASAKQLEHATAHPRIRYTVATAEASLLPDASVDIVTVAQALHWLDRPSFFAEAKRVLKPGGLIAVFGYTWFYISQEIDALVNEHLLQPAAPYWLPYNQLLWDGYRTVEFPFEELTPPRLAIYVRWNLEQVLAYYLTSSGPRAAIRALGNAFLLRAQALLRDAWGDPDQPRQVVMPLGVRIGRHRTDA
jgi:SAM-dependent methyltransferase